jgi:hypothetical protein
LIEGYFKDEVEQQVEGSLYDWLIDQTVAQGGRQQRIQEAVHKMEKGVESEYVGLHRAYLQREAERLRKIVEEKDRVQREFEEAREARRERRRQLRVSRTKRKFLEEIDAQVYSKRTVEPEVFSLKVVALTDQDSQVKKFRTYGGLFFEWWVLFSFCRNTLHKKVEGAFEKFLLEDDVKKLFLGFLSDVVIKEGSIRVNINKKYKSDFEEALEQMNSNLLAFNQTKEEMITKFVAKEDLLVGVAIQHVIKLHILDQNIYEALLKNLLRIYFKSNDYKIEDTVVEKVSGQEAVGEATEQIVGGSDQNTEGQTAANKGDDIQDPKAQSEKGSSHKAPEIKKQVLPEITEEDRKIEQLKKKLDINFLEEEETLPSRFDGVFRIKESINRDEVNPRARALSESKLQAEQGEVSADPFLDVKMHGRSYLLEKHLGKLRETEEEKARQREAEKQQRKDRYIEQYLGDTYERDLDRHSLEDMERPATNLLEATELSGGRKVLFLHQINQLLFRLAMLEKMKDYFTKEMFFLKDSNINEMIRPIDKELETLITPMLVHTDRNLTPIYDKES